MKKLVFLFLIISSSIFAQDPKINKATMQTVHHGASPTSTTTYSIYITKTKKGNWSIDSVVGISSGTKIKFNLLEVINLEASSPDEKKASPEKLKKGNYRISFGITKQRGSGRAGAPQNLKADTTNIEGGVIIYYSIKKKQNQLKVDTFEVLETVDTP